MIHYHGIAGMNTGTETRLLKARHAMISFARPESVCTAAELCQSFALDNGAFSAWKSGETLDVVGYLDWVKLWARHPSFDFCLIPDVIDGNEEQNDELLNSWGLPNCMSVPVWHMHESIPRLERLCEIYQRVAIGSSGAYRNPGEEQWWDRMSEAMDAISNDAGQPPCKLHGLRMMNPTIYSHVPFASVDSSTVARNLAFDKRWDNHMYLRGLSKGAKALILAERMESHASAGLWTHRHSGTNTGSF